MKIPFTVQNFTEADNLFYYASGGIPLPISKITDRKLLTINDKSGKAVNAQIDVTGYWPDGSIKWVLITIPVRLTAECTKKYYLTISKNPSRAKNLPPLISENCNSVNVDNGKLKFIITKNSPELISNLSLINAKTGATDSNSTLFASLAHNKGTKYSEQVNYRSISNFTVKVEQNGKFKGVIRIKGTHQTEQGKKFAPFDTRIYIYRNNPLIKVVHTFIYDGNPQTDFLQSIGLKLQVRQENIKGFSLSASRGKGIYTECRQRKTWPYWSGGRLSQTSANNFSIKKWIDKNKNSHLKILEGNQSQGWGSIISNNYILSLGIRNFWQEYPKAIEIDCKQGTISAELYSADAAPLDLRRYSDLGYCAIYEAGSKLDAEPIKFDRQKYNAQYIAKTSEIFILFEENKSLQNSTAAYSLLFQKPPLLRPAINWIAKTGVFRNYSTISPKIHKKAHDYYCECINFIINEQDYRNWYSFLDYGDTIHSFDPERDCWRFDQGGYAWHNNEGLTVEGFWQAYLATGDERMFRFAEAATRHSGDVDMFHKGKLAGCGMRHNVNHWGDSNRERRMTIAFNKRIYYFLTGDEHTRDLIEFSYRKICKPQESNGLMDFGVAGAALLFLWETSNNDKYGDILQKLAENICLNMPNNKKSFPRSIKADFRIGHVESRQPDKQSPIQSFFLLDFGPIEMLLNTEQLTGSKIIRESIINWSKILFTGEKEREKYQPQMGAGKKLYSGTMRVAAWAYEKTGDKKYLKFIEKGLNTKLVTFKEIGGDKQLDTPRHFIPKLDNSSIYLKAECGHALHLGRIMNNFPFGIAALKINKHKKNI